MTALMLPAGRGERRTRIYDDFGHLLYDSCTSDEHPHDFMRSRGLREVNAVIDFHNVIGPFGRPHRWSGKICQRSRRRFENVDFSEYLQRYLMGWPTPWWRDDPLFGSSSPVSYAEHFAQPSSPYTVVDMYGRDSTPARWAPVVEPEHPQLGFSPNTLAARAARALEAITPYLLTEGLI